jgi:hypothetical protein
VPDEPSVRQLAVLVAWIECGDSPCAAERLGMTSIRVRQILSELHAILGVRTTVQAAAVAIRDGLIDADSLNIAA